MIWMLSRALNDSGGRHLPGDMLWQENDTFLHLTHTDRSLFFLFPLLYDYTWLASAILCWDCSSHINPGCGEPFNNYSFAQVDCSQRSLPHMPEIKSAAICRKIVQKSKWRTSMTLWWSEMKESSLELHLTTYLLAVQDDPKPRIVRGCGWITDSSTDGQCVRRSGTFSVLVEYCSCQGDGCNGATSLASGTILIASIFAALSALYAGRLNAL